MTITIPGYTSLTGRPHTILRLMLDARLWDPKSMTVEEYIKTVKTEAWRFYGILLNVTGDTIEEQAESLLREMARYHLIEIQD